MLYEKTKSVTVWVSSVKILASKQRQTQKLTEKGFGSFRNFWKQNVLDRTMAMGPIFKSQLNPTQPIVSRHKVSILINYIRQVNGVTGEILCDAFFLPSVRPSLSTQYLDANISKTVWDRDLVPINH